MIRTLTAFIFLSALSLSAEDPLPVTVMEVGHSVTFICSHKSNSETLFNAFFYKQIPGHMAQIIALMSGSISDVDDSFKDKRFHFTTVNNLYNFTIAMIRKEDEAIYICHSTNFYGVGFLNSTFLIVNDRRTQQKCVHVRQSPSSASVLSGGSVSLQCSLQSKNNTNVQCPPQHKVHWFRAGSVEPQTGVMFNFTNSSCVYSLSKTIGQSSDAGTYHCAVDTCGHILFGDGTRVEMERPSEQHPDPVIMALSVLLSCCVLVIIVLSVCLKRRRLCAHCRDALHTVNSSCDSTTKGSSQSTDGGAADVNYAALNFSSRKVKQNRKTRREQECVYSTVRADHLTSL